MLEPPVGYELKHNAQRYVTARLATGAVMLPRRFWSVSLHFSWHVSKETVEWRRSMFCGMGSQTAR